MLCSASTEAAGRAAEGRWRLALAARRMRGMGAEWFGSERFILPDCCRGKRVGKHGLSDGIVLFRGKEP